MVEQTISASIRVKEQMLSDKDLLKKIEQATATLIKTFREGGRVFFCGNGGSAADAQHLAAELSGRFYFDRDPLPAEALHVNTSFLTAVANDYSWEEAFARYMKAHGKKGDTLVAISTSGNSANILRALDVARELGIHTIGLTGSSGGLMKGRVDLLLPVPSDDTPRIQEAQILIGHIICQQVEAELFGK
ncbi:MAG TPA: SIS domain-containing protein [Bacteroidetes bacterium]|nr:SIS domain-containing protein [Bacteroidota bacterium]